MKKFLIYFGVSVSLLLTAAGCSTNGVEEEIAALSAELNINIASSTRATGDASDGGKMTNLLVLLTSSDNIITHIWGTDDGNGNFSASNLDAAQDTQSIHFEGLNVGNYTIYAFANTDGYDYQVASHRVGEQFSGDDTFPALTGTNVPQYQNNMMPLTACKTVSVGSGSNSAQVTMLRNVARMSLTVYNHSDYDVRINSLTFGQFNASTAYVCSHGSTISAGTYRSLPSLSTTPTVAARSNDVIYSTYLYENQATSDQYKFSMSVSAMHDGTAYNVNASSELSSTGDITTSSVYAIRNYRNDGYLTDNDGTITTVSSPNNNSYWRFVASGSYYMLQNVGTGRYIAPRNGTAFTQSATSESGADTFAIGYSTRFYFRCSTNSGNTRYFIRSSSVGNADYYTRSSDQPSTSTARWIIYNTTLNSIATTEASNVPIKRITSTGAAEQLTQMLRNEFLNVEINVYYNNTDSSFEFTVDGWNSKNEEVEFN